jgi:hypothetical protein
VNGEEPSTGSVNEVKDVPENFKKWLTENSSRIERAEKRGTLPYFIKDNASFVEEAKEVTPANTGTKTKSAKADITHRALKPIYETGKEIVDSFNQINDGLPEGEKWFKNGFNALEITTNPHVNGTTNRATGKILLKKDRMENLKSALSKIANGKSSEISEAEADTMATFWHEITHNRHGTLIEILSKTQRNYMELANEFTARKTLPEFYNVLGVKDMPHKQFMDGRRSTLYDPWVNNYDSVIKTSGLDSDKVLSSVKQHLFTASYRNQVTGLKQGLIDGGIKKLDGTKLKTKELNDLLKICIEDDSTDVLQYMKAIGVIR